jgi:hypothetical protein
MKPIEPPTRLESLAGSKSAEIVLTAVAASAGGLFAPLLPVLAKSLAADRQRLRVEATLEEIRSTLEANEQAVRHLSDEQYRIVNETISAVFSTTSAEKMALLRRAVSNAIKPTDYQPKDAAALSRMLRDITAEEAAFLAEAFRFEILQINPKLTEMTFGKKMLRVAPGTHEAICIHGLLSIGIVSLSEGNWDGSSIMRFTPFAAKLLALLRENS